MLHNPADGQLTSEPEGRLGALRCMLQRLSAAPPEGKTGSFQTEGDPAQDYPWASRGATDRLDLLTDVDRAGPREDLLPRIQDLARSWTA